jgi:hypothetical protein
MPYPELLRCPLSTLAHQRGIVTTAEEENGFVNSVTAWKAFPDTMRTIQRLGRAYPMGRSRERRCDYV